MKIRILKLAINVVILGAAICGFLLTQKLETPAFVNDWAIICAVFLFAAILILPLVYLIRRESGR